MSLLLSHTIYRNSHLPSIARKHELCLTKRFIVQVIKHADAQLPSALM